MLGLFDDLDSVPPKVDRIRSDFKHLREERYLRLPHASVLLADGHAEFHTEDFSMSLKPGDVIVLPPGRTRHFVRPKNLMLRFAHFYPTQPHLKDRGFAFHSGEKFFLLRTTMDALILDSVRNSPALTARFWSFLFTLDEIYRGQQHGIGPMGGDPRVEAILDTIHRHRADPLSIAEMADQLGISHNHLSRLFRHATGMTIIQYVQKVRMEMAEEQLTRTSIPIKEIARYCGFRSLQYFNRAVHRTFHCSPTELRESRQKAQ